MDWNTLYPAGRTPTIDDMTAYIGGEGKTLWLDLLSYMRDAYSVKPKLTYSGCSGKPDWNVKHQKSGASFGTLYPEPDGFSVFVVIAYRLDMEMELVKLRLSESMRARYESAGDYMNMGRWMMFEVRTGQDLDDYKLLMSAKMPPKNKEEPA